MQAIRQPPPPITGGLYADPIGLICHNGRGLSLKTSDLIYHNGGGLLKDPFAQAHPTESGYLLMVARKSNYCDAALRCDPPGPRATTQNQR